MTAKLTRGRLVMANFICQLDWPWGARLNIISGYLCKSVSG